MQNLFQPQSFDWKWFRFQMASLASQHDREWEPLLDLVGVYDGLVGRLVDRPLSFALDRPQDYVACILAVRSFRLTVGALHLCASGYRDLSPNLVRTVWEIGVRLLDLRSDPIAGALGYLLQGYHEEVHTMEAELVHRKPSAEPLGNLELNLATTKSIIADLEGICSRHGLDPHAARREHGKINLRQVCERFGIEKSYHVSFTRMSGYVHEKNVASDDFIHEAENIRYFEFGPIREGAVHSAVDAMTEFALVMSNATDVVGDPVLAQEADDLLGTVEKRYRLCPKQASS